MIYFVFAMLLLIPCAIILYRYYMQPVELQRSKSISEKLKEANIELRWLAERNQLSLQRIKFLEEKILTRELADNLNLPWPTVNDVDRKRILEILEKEYNASQE